MHEESIGSLTHPRAIPVPGSLVWHHSPPTLAIMPYVLYLSPGQPHCAGTRLSLRDMSSANNTDPLDGMLYPLGSSEFWRRTYCTIIEHRKSLVHEAMKELTKVLSVVYGGARMEGCSKRFGSRTDLARLDSDQCPLSDSGKEATDNRRTSGVLQYPLTTGIRNSPRWTSLESFRLSVWLAAGRPCRYLGIIMYVSL